MLEHAAETIPALAAVARADAFAPFFTGLLPLLLCKMKQGCTVAEKSFAVGTLAESIQSLGAASAQFVSRLLPVLLSAARETDPKVRSNAIFGLGVLTEHGGRPAQEYPQLARVAGVGMGECPWAPGWESAFSLTVHQILLQTGGVPVAPPGTGAS